MKKIAIITLAVLIAPFALVFVCASASWYLNLVAEFGEDIFTTLNNISNKNY